MHSSGGKRDEELSGEEVVVGNDGLLQRLGTFGNFSDVAAAGLFRTLEGRRQHEPDRRDFPLKIGEKNRQRTEDRGLYYKPFYCRNLRIFVIS